MVASKTGRLELHATDEHGHNLSEAAVFLLSENKAQLAKQYRLESKPGAHVSGNFPAGPYTVQALARGYEVAREVIEVHPDRLHKSSFHLEKAAKHAPLTVEERLSKRYGIKAGKDGLQNLTAAPGQKISLNYQTYTNYAHFQVLHAQSLSDLRRWVGSAERVTVGKHPRFGPLPSLQGLAGERANLSAAQQALVTGVANEYIYGNPDAVPADELQLVNTLFKQIANISVPIFLFLDITIDNGATLEVGNGSSVFVCNTLTIYPEGTLSVVGDLRADIGNLVQL
jgi:hypothetical protein